MPSSLSVGYAASSQQQDLGKLILRLTLGLLLLLHGVAKLRSGVDGIVGMVGQAGLPPAVAYLVYVGEVIAPILILLGLFTRAAALVVMVNMLVAVSLAHMSQLTDLVQIRRLGAGTSRLLLLQRAGSRTARRRSLQRGRGRRSLELTPQRPPPVSTHR